MQGTIAMTDSTSPALAIFTLGHAEASLSFLTLLPETTRDNVTSTLAYRLLSMLWAQYRVDCGIGHGRTLFSLDNGYELRLFAALVDNLADWAPLRSAAAAVRAHSPALSGAERHIYESEFEAKQQRLLEVSDQLQRLPVDLDPTGRCALLIDRCQKLEELDDYGICWALNLVGAFHMNVLGGTKASPAFPALFRREMLRFDRSKSWRDRALRSALAGSAHTLSEAILGSIHGQKAFQAEFSGLRHHSRLGLAHAYLAGIGELSPALLGRLLLCSEPGARKMLRQLVAAGFARHSLPGPAYSHVERFRLGWAQAPWLRFYSLDVDPAALDRFDD